MKSPKKTVSRRKFIKKSRLLSAAPVIAAGLAALHEKRVVEWKEVAL